jgi:hypothetical protein
VLAKERSIAMSEFVYGVFVEDGEEDYLVAAFEEKDEATEYAKNTFVKLVEKAWEYGQRRVALLAAWDVPWDVLDEGYAAAYECPEEVDYAFA